MVRWLHISDVHECDKENYHRKAMYDEIIAAAQERNPKPHLVFITGDLAFSGNKDEYKSFRTRLFDPLKAALPDGCPIFMVPGNHDVDRDAVTKPRNWIEDPEELKAFQAVSAAGLRKRERYAAAQILCLQEIGAIRLIMENRLACFGTRFGLPYRDY